MIIFSFQTDEESFIFCKKIAEIMVELFEIPEDEAIGRINRLWRNKDFVGFEDLRYHQDEEFWANDIYYGADSYWWKKTENLKPLPFNR